MNDARVLRDAADAADPASAADLVEAVKRVAAEIAAAHADEVDRDARFPHEAVAALKRERALGALIPRALGGHGARVVELCAMIRALGRHCAATAMIFAMHHVKVASIVRHGLSSPYFRAYLEELCERQLLLASATSEVGTGGHLRASVCAIEPAEGGFRVIKRATTVSYGAHADDLALTARRTPSAPPSDQVLAVVRRGGFKLEGATAWDTLGMRGTCSPGFTITASGSMDQIVPAPFSEIASQSMVPFSHILWSAVWLGIAEAAASRARAFVRREARKKPGAVPLGATRAADLVAQVHLMRSNLEDAARTCDALMGHDGLATTSRLASMGFAIRINEIKLASSRLVVDVVRDALLVCGLAGYRNDSELSLGRHLRDACSAALMINDDRIRATNAALLLVHKDD